MQDFIVGIGFAFMIEGALWALFPHKTRQMVLQIAASPENVMRSAGLLAAVLGFGLVYWVRG